MFKVTQMVGVIDGVRRQVFSFLDSTFSFAKPSYEVKGVLL